MGIIGPGGGAFVLNDIPGFADGFVVKYKTTTDVTISGGSYESDGSLFTLAADATHPMTGLVAGFTRHYVYLDKSASVPAVPVFYDDTAEPVRDISRNGSYHPSDTEDRVVGAVLGKASILLVFTGLQLGNVIRSEVVGASELTIAGAVQLTGVYITPPNRESSVVLPVNAVEAEFRISMGAGSNNSGGVATNEWAAVDTGVGAAPFFMSATDAISSGQNWIAMGASRNVKIGGTTPAFGFSISVSGFGIVR